MSNSSKLKKKRGFARIEFLAVKPDVTKLLDAGHTFQSAYDELFESGKITMSYPIFAKYARKGVKLALVKKSTGTRTKKVENNDIPKAEQPAPKPSQSHERVLGVAETTSFKNSSSPAERNENI
ncbi:MAG: TraK family protein [Halodesulfovibrio sp.]|uniref:TraK family protein n=1 Tax=Halodesulfovibrio sp. TaxID=1912772 RepID=UPI00359D336F